MSSERTKYVTAEGSVTAKTGASAASCQSPASYGHIPVTHRSPSVVRTSLFLFACIVTHCNAGEVSLAVTMQAQYLSLRLHCNAGAVSLAPQPAMMSCRATSTRVVLPPPDGRQIFGVCKASASAHTHTHTHLYTHRHKHKLIKYKPTPLSRTRSSQSGSSNDSLRGAATSASDESGLPTNTCHSRVRRRAIVYSAESGACPRTPLGR